MRSNRKIILHDIIYQAAKSNKWFKILCSNETQVENFLKVLKATFFLYEKNICHIILTKLQECLSFYCGQFNTKHIFFICCFLSIFLLQAKNKIGFMRMTLSIV